MANKIYRLALIGCGTMGAAHLDDIIHLENVVIKCVCDLKIENAEHYKKVYHADYADRDYRVSVSREDVDIVIICTYPSTHLEILRECIRNGKHVICEKPIADNLENGKEAVNLIKNNPQCKVLIGYILRHNETYCKVAEMIQAGAIGKPVVMRMSQNHHTMNWNKYLNLIKDTSPILDCGVHYIDVMRWFTGEELTSVSGIGARTEEDIPENTYNYGLMTAKLSGGSVGFYEAGWSNTITAENTKELIGPKGKIRIVLQMNRSIHQEEGDLIEYYTYPERRYETININCKRKPTGAQLQTLIDMIEGNNQAVPSIEDVWESFCWACEADRVIKSNLGGN
ncbi:MAG: Gfo/Idh/MocA family oxidoreductase [Clostridia bacterium]|nr:Gfo/Idh/MocA family oxidoreductase [Clostridia bacterium]